MPWLLARLAFRALRRAGAADGPAGWLVVEVSFVAMVALLVVAPSC
jgi:hypothetical protein